MGKNQDLYERAKEIIPGGTQLFSKRPELHLSDLWPAYYKEAKGCEIRDLDNKRYTDMSFMGDGACVLGYADGDVDKAVKNALDKGSMTTLNCPEEMELAELLCEIHPWANMVRLARTGEEAVIMAVRIARANTGRDGILCLSDDLADDKGQESKDVPGDLKEAAILFEYNDIEDFLKAADENKGKIAAVVMEPVRNHQPAKNFLEIIRERTRKEGIVLIFNEINSGWRLNLGGAHMSFDVEPDIAVFAKGMSNGYPMSAVIGSKDVMDVAKENFISSTYWTERIGPVAAIATIKKIQKNNVCAHLIEAGKMVQDGWVKAAEKHGLKIEVAGIAPLSRFSFCYDGP
ncbi:aminotransferase class III-fold pyridoxal phosphate-dependent enzyme, partial [Candidatus Omnitrophota bacterium]